MANIHVLNFGTNGYRVVVHIPVPAGNNGQGVPWQSALINSKCCGAGSTVMATGDGTGANGTITSAELAQIQSGAIYEEVFELDVGSVQPAGRAAFLDAHAAAKVTEVQARLQHHLAFFGFTR